MELNLAGTQGIYTIRDGPAHASKKSIAASYAKIVTLATGFGLICTTYWVLSSLTTSFNGRMGSFSLGIIFFGFLTTLFITPTLLDILGGKTCAVGSGFCALIYSASYFYPSWYTFMPSSLVMGVGYGLLYASSGTIKNDEVRRCVEHWKIDPVTYQGRFSGIVGSFGIGASSFVAGGISIGILSSFSNNSTMLSSSVAILNSTMSQDSCVNDSSITQPATVSVDLKTYYTLVATIAGVSLVSITTLSIMRGAAYHQCRVRSFGLKEALCTTAAHAVKVFKQASTPAYGLVLPLRMNQGFVIAYMAGVFTKRYVTECVGVEFVGVCIITMGAFATLGGFGSGWLMRFTTSYVMVLVCIGGLEVGSFIFLIVWTRQPSFAVIVVISAVFGLCYGLNATVALAYSGIAPGDSKIGYNILVMGHAGAQVVEFFLSELILPEKNLYVILVVTILAVPLFTVADIHYGSGTSRNICGKKKPVVVDNGDTKCDPVSNSKETGVPRPGKLRRESTVPLVEDGRKSELSMNGSGSPPSNEGRE